VDEGKYYVQVKNICGIVSDTVTFMLDRDNVELGNDTMICIQEPLVLLADQPSATDWLWQDGSTLPYYEADTEGDYFVLVTTPCQFIMDSIFVYTQDCSLHPPNIITPNGDGVNDYFVLPNIDLLGYDWSLEIFNRWGEQVYYSPDYQNDWNGSELSDGVYFYIIRTSSSSISYNGSVTIVRK
jgi:gliding motility-associated-like protein